MFWLSRNLGFETLSHLLRITQKPRGELRLRSPGLCDSVFSQFQSLYATHTTGLQYYSLKEQNCSGQMEFDVSTEVPKPFLSAALQRPYQAGHPLLPFHCGQYISIHLFLHSGKKQPTTQHRKNQELWTRQEVQTENRIHLTKPVLFFPLFFSRGT